MELDSFRSYCPCCEVVFKNRQSSENMDSRVSPEQLEILLDHLSRHPGIAKGYGLGGRSKETSERLWNELAAKLNAVGNGATKTSVQWKRYWIDLKHKAKSRAAMLRKEHSGTGGGPSQHRPLSDVFQKALAIIGEEAAYGDTQYRVPAFDAEETFPLSVRRQLFPRTETITSAQTQAFSPPPSASRANREINSPSIHGHTMIVIECADETTAENANRPPETCPTFIVPAAPTEAPETQPMVSPSRKRRRSANLRSTTDNSWVVDLERRRISAEEKLSEAAMFMAVAAKMQAQAFLNLTELLKNII